MKQILQSLSSGEAIVAEIPAPIAENNSILIQSNVSLISSGTERMLVNFGKSNLIGKALQQPARVGEVIAKAKVDGVSATYNAVKTKLDQPITLGYSNVGIVVSENTPGFKVGERVVSNGSHAEFVVVKKHLCAKIPDNVSNKTAAFTVLGSIGLQGIRLAQLTLGEVVVVYGVGVIGLLTVQMLKAHGCRVIAIDIDDKNLKLANEYGAETFNILSGLDVGIVVNKITQSQGVDAVIITASSKKHDIISTAAKISRKRGRIVLVGDVGLDLKRSDFFEKELTFQVSCSYGPGRYDSNYENLGNDYPIGFVRWTEQRNFDAVLQLMAEGKILTDKLITHEFSISQGVEAISELSSRSRNLGILISYPSKLEITTNLDAPIPLKSPNEINLSKLKNSDIRVIFWGAGAYASKVLIPHFKNAGSELVNIVSKTGVSAFFFGSKHGFRYANTNLINNLNEDSGNIVVIATQHNLHAEQVLLALRAGKHVFCEKPLCLKAEELKEISDEMKKRENQILMVGFNRRFSPLVKKVKDLIDKQTNGIHINITVNAGAISEDHWVQDVNVGGGRIIGEACHFIDLARFLAKSEIVNKNIYYANDILSRRCLTDQATIVLNFKNGSIANINYLSNGHKSFPKERLEVFSGGKILQLDNFKTLRGYGWKNFSSQRLFSQNKGQKECVEAFINAIKNDLPQPILLSEILEVSETSIELAKAGY